MPEHNKPSPVQILKSIEAGSRRVNELATDLSRRISSFEAWLNALPGKVETSLWLGASEDAPCEPEFGLRLARHSSTWALFYAYSWPGNEEFQWSSLGEASLETKILAVKQFPQLLQKITEAQTALAKRLEDTHRDFDAFAAAIGLTQRKES